MTVADAVVATWLAADVYVAFNKLQAIVGAAAIGAVYAAARVFA